ncbi:MAG: aspartyl protease family protein [Terracidiphilus sp.]
MPGRSVGLFARMLTGILSTALACAGAQTQDSRHVAPLQIDHEKPIVEVMINGKGPFPFVIDTGTGGQAFVSAALADQLALPRVGQVTLNDPSGQGGRKVPVVLLGSLQVAGVEFTGIRAAVHNLGNGDGLCQGLLGFALFRDYLLTLDYPNHRIVLDSGHLYPDGGRTVLPLRMNDGIPVVTLAIGATAIEAQLDSGGSGLSLPSLVASHLKFNSEFATRSDAHSLSTRFTLVGATLAADVHLGSYTFKRPFVEINPAFPLANFGSSPMQCFTLTFDQKNRLVRFDAQQKKLHISTTPTSMGLQNAPHREPVDATLIPVG